MTSSTTQRASSFTFTCIHSSYHVFLSFRGKDTRKNFTDHLYTTLVAYGPLVFRDDEQLEKGGDIASDLSRAIEDWGAFLHACCRGLGKLETIVVIVWKNLQPISYISKRKLLFKTWFRDFGLKGRLYSLSCLYLFWMEYRWWLLAKFEFKNTYEKNETNVCDVDKWGPNIKDPLQRYV